MENKLENVNSFDDMKLHDYISLGENSDPFAVNILIVFGGWIYTIFDKSHNIQSSVFIPYCETLKGEHNGRA